MQSAYGTRSIFMWFGGVGLPCALLLVTTVRDPSIEQRRRRLLHMQAEAEDSAQYGSVSALKEEHSQYAHTVSVTYVRQ